VRVWGFTALLCLLGSLAVTRLAMAEVVIVNDAVSVRQVEYSTLRLTFTKRLTHWPSGQVISVFVYPDRNRDHVDFAKRQLGLFPYQLRDLWDRAVFSGTGQPPYLVYSAEEMLHKVALTRGAIGYLKQLPKELPEGVRVLVVKERDFE